MSAMGLVARRELREQVKDKSFLWGTVITLLLVLAFAVLPRFFGGGPDTADVAAVGPEARAVVARAITDAPAADARLTLRELPDRAAAEKALASGDVRVAVVDEQILVRDDPSGTAVQLVQGASARIRLEKSLAAAGVSPDRARAALDQPPLAVRATDPRASERDARESLAFIGLVVLFVSILTTAVMVAFGVVEEKSSRVVEVLLAAVRPRDLLGGKVIGLGILGVGQLLVIAIPGFIAARLAGTLDISLTTSPAILVTLLIWFILGYAIYSAMFAAAASLVSRQEDLQATITPISLLVQGAFGLGFFAAADPGGTVAQVLTFVPPIAPFVVPLRVAQQEISPLAQAIAIVVAVLCAVLLVLVAARIYERAILRMGSRVRWRDALHFGSR